MKSFLAPLLLLTVAAMALASCHHEARDQCGPKMRGLIPVGSSAEFAESVLKQCHFETNRNAKTNSIYADKRTTSGLVTERTQVSILLDKNNKVTSVQVSIGLIGP